MSGQEQAGALVVAVRQAEKEAEKKKKKKKGIINKHDAVDTFMLENI